MTDTPKIFGREPTTTLKRWSGQEWIWTFEGIDISVYENTSRSPTGIPFYRNFISPEPFGSSTIISGEYHSLTKATEAVETDLRAVAANIRKAGGNNDPSTLTR